MRKKYYRIAYFLNKHIISGKLKFSGQAYGLASSIHKQFSSLHNIHP